MNPYDNIPHPSAPYPHTMRDPYANNPYLAPSPSPPQGLPNGLVHSLASNPSTAHTKDLFFVSTPPYQPPPPQRPTIILPPPRSDSFPPQYSAPYTAPPPVQSEESSRPPYSQDSHESESPSEDKQLQMALEISKSESAKYEETMQSVMSQEEEQLTQALKESMVISINSYSSGTAEAYCVQPGSSRCPSDPSTPTHHIAKTSSPADGKGGAPVNADQFSDDEAFARMLAEEDKVEELRRSNSQKHVLDEDEVLARQLAEAEEEEIRARSSSPPQDPTSPRPIPPTPPSEPISVCDMPEPMLPPSSSPTLPPVTIPSTSQDDLSSDPPPQNEVSPPQPISSQSSSYSSPDYFSSRNVQYPQKDIVAPHMSFPGKEALLYVPPPCSSTSPRDSLASTEDLPSQSDVSRSNSSGSKLSRASSQAESWPTSITIGTQNLNDSDSSPMSNTPVLEGAPYPPSPLNQFISLDLLRGISIGFHIPTITDDIEPMMGAIPNVVSLPYGKCPPLHLKAPSWRHLLRLLARLSSSRLEPSVITHAVAKDTTYRLRTVIQFIKSHAMSQKWHTVIWFTIDHPVPPALPGAQKYTCNDVNVLPFSYTLSSLPTLLRDAEDSPVSKTYTIPSTEKTPYPALPITFPNLAMYLQASLDESRRYLDDGSSGMRKLARSMEACYPSLDNAQFPDLEAKRSVGGMFKRVIKGKSKKSGKGGGNNETYELVTPFVPDEWG